MTPAVPSDRPEVLPNAIPIISQWRRLASMDRQSPDFALLLSSLTAEDNRSSTTQLCGDDAAVVLGLIDEVLRKDKIPGEYRYDTLCTMRMLGYSSGRVPSHYQVDRQFLTVEAPVIASGTFANVRKGKLGDKVVAVRTLRTDQQTDHDRAQKLFCKECIIWMNVSHPNLLGLIAVDINPSTGQYSTISEMMMNGNIKEYIRKNSANRHQLLKDVATGLYYLHKRGIVHGDLKGQNILITNDAFPRACLADFGLSTPAPGTQGAMTTVTTGGTPMFMAPELLCPVKFGKSSARPTQSADIYALGMVIYEVLTGFQPFHEEKWAALEIMCNVMTGARPAKPADAEKIGFGDGTWELVEGCWVEESTRRPTIDQVLAHLTRVAVHSKVVDPTPDKPRESTVDPTLSDSSSHIRLFLTSDTNHCTDTSGTIGSPVSTRSMSSTAYTVISSVGPVPSSDKGDSHSKFKFPTIKLPFQRSILTTKLWVDPKAINSTIPMPIPFSPKANHSRFHGFIDKLKPKRAIRSSAATRKA